MKKKSRYQTQKERIEKDNKILQEDKEDRITWKCPICGNINEPDDKFCLRCKTSKPE